MKKIFVIAVLLVVVQFPFGQHLPDLSGDCLGQTTSGNTPVAFAPGIISRYSLDHGPAVFAAAGNYYLESYLTEPIGGTEV